MKKIMVIVLFVLTTQLSFSQRDTVLYKYILAEIDSNSTVYYYNTPKILYSTYDTKKLDRSNVEDFTIMKMSTKTIAENDSLFLSGSSGGSQQGVDVKYKLARKDYYFKLYSKVYFKYEGAQCCLLKMYEHRPDKKVPSARSYVYQMKDNKWYSILPNSGFYNLFAVFFAIDAKYIDDVLVYKTSKNTSLDEVIKQSKVGSDLDLAKFCTLMTKKVEANDSKIMEVIEKL